jgi:hypothetical protein
MLLIPRSSALVGQGVCATAFSSSYVWVDATHNELGRMLGVPPTG